MRKAPFHTAALSLCLTGTFMACKATPCVTSATCGGGTCVGGVCEATPDPNNRSVIIFPATDGGVRLDAGAGGVDASVAAGDAGSFIVPLSVVPTAVAFNDTGAVLVVASGGSTTPMHLESHAVPITTAAPAGVDLQTGGVNCPVGQMVLRSTQVFTACAVPGGTPRVFNLNNGQLVGAAAPLLSGGAMMVDHNAMVGVAPTGGAGGTAYPNPSTDGASTIILFPMDTMANTGVGLVELNCAILGHISATGSGGLSVNFSTFASNVFAFESPVSVTAPVNGVTFIVSGRPIAGATPALQPVVLANAASGELAVYDGVAMKNATSGAMLSPAKSYNGLSLSTGGTNARIKISVDGRYAFSFNAQNSQMCRVALNDPAATTAECEDLTLGCAPVDFAPRVGTSGTVVACTGNGGFLEVHPAL